MLSFLLGAIAATFVALLIVHFRLEIARFFQARIDNLEDIVGDFTTLDERLGAYIERERGEIADRKNTIREAEADIEAANARVGRAEKSRSVVKNLAGE